MGEHPLNHLCGYTGTVHADGFAGFNGLFGPDRADEQACMVHVRRRFYDEAKRTGAPIAKHALKLITRLYAVEDEARGKSPEERVALGQEKAKPVFDELRAWLHAQPPKLSGKSRLVEAIRYALNRMPKARGHLADGRLELDKISVSDPSARSPCAAGTTSSWGPSEEARPPPSHTPSSRPPG